MSFPGPDELGRGVVVRPGAAVPAAFADAPRLTIDDAVLESPQVLAAMAAVLHEAWAERRRVVIELAVSVDALREPETERRPPYELDPGFTFERERLQFLVWANNYDARRSGEPIWWHGVRASRIGATLGGPADVLLADGTPAWCDGGPRRPVLRDDAQCVVVHRDSIDAGLLTAARFTEAQADLAADQLAAVAHPGGPARIIAPAGSGKTRVLTERVRHLLVDRGYEPGVVTAVAYNVMAAEQLRERTTGFRPTIRTLNSLGLNVCSRRGDWRIAEEPFCREVLAGLVKTTRKVGTDPLAPYLDALATIRLGLVPPEKAEDLHPDAAGIAAAFPAYRDVLHSAGRLDFDEQIYKAIELLLADPELRAEVRAEARTLLVDEFQDLTPAHLLLIRLVAGPAADVFGVGDDDQVIYGYAGADPGFLIDYRRYFPGAATYDLQVNYRCPPAIVDAARTLLSHNRRRIDKTIRPADTTSSSSSSLSSASATGCAAVSFTAAVAGRAQPVAPHGALVVRATTSDEMGPAAIEAVRQWAEAGVPFSDMAVLTRVNSSLLPVQLLLDQAGIPYRAAVGPWILERAGTAAALAYLRIAADPTRITRADLRATVRRPSRKISPKAIDMLARDAVTSVRSIRGLATWLADKDAFVKDADRVDAYAADLDALAEAMAKPGTTTADLLRFIRDTIGLGEAMETLDASKGALDRSSNGDDLAALLQVAPLYPDPATFETWLQQALVARPMNGDTDSPGVHLATVHKVKGREWSHVVVFGSDAGLFPHRLSADVEEERRIFHVAVTRARSQAVVLADSAGPSPFVDELRRAAPPRPAADPSDPNPFRRLAMPDAPAAPTSAGRTTTKGKAKATNGEPGFAATLGAEITLAGGLRATIKEIRRGEVLAETATGSTGVSFGTAIRVAGENVRLVAPPGRVTAGIAALKAWRTALAKQEGKPPYVYLSDAHITDIAERDPDTTARLARCKGIGPGKLESYGETILGLLDDL